MAVIDELIAVLGFDLQNEEDAKRFDKKLNDIGVSLNKLAKKAGRFAAVTTGAMATAFGFFGKSVIDTSAQFETFSATLETIEGSAEKAQASLDWIAEFGKTTPYDVAQVTDSFVKLKAYGIDPIADNALRTLGDTAAAMGKPLNQAVEAFADAATGEFERLKEFGMKAKTEGDNVTFAWTENGKELTKTVKKGSNEIRAFLLQNMGDRFAGAMDKQSRTWKGMMSNLGDTWVDFQRRVGEAGFFEHVSGRLEAFLGWLRKLDADGTLDRWATTLSDALTSAAMVVETFVTQSARHIMFLSENFDSLQPYIVAVGVALGVLIAVAFPLTSIFVAIGIALDDFLTYLQGGESIIGSFIESAVRIANELPGKIMNALMSLVDDLKNLGYDMGVALFEGLKNIGSAIKDWFASLIPDWAKDFVSLPDGSSASGSIGGPMVQTNSSNKSTPENGLGSLTNNLQGNLNRLGSTQPLNDNRNQALTQTVTINQNVQQATDAPGAAAEATGNAVTTATRRQRTQSESEPSF